MSTVDGVIDDPQPQPVDAAPEPQVEPPAPTEDDIPEAVEVSPGQRVVPVGVVKALREELRQLKPLAEQAQQLDAYVRDVRPYVEFLKANPNLLQPQTQPQPAAPQTDPALVELARTLELYDPATGQPDVARAAKIRDLTRAEAQAIADQRIAPLQEGTHEQRAAANLQAILATKDADGRPLEQQYVVQAVQTITSSLPSAEAKRILADPKVAQLLRLTALGMQASAKKSGPVPPTEPPLHVESPGGGGGVVLSEDSRRLAKLAGIPEKDYAERAKRFQPGRSNVLE